MWIMWINCEIPDSDFDLKNLAVLVMKTANIFSSCLKVSPLRLHHWGKLMRMFRNLCRYRDRYDRFRLQK